MRETDGRKMSVCLLILILYTTDCLNVAEHLSKHKRKQIKTLAISISSVSPVSSEWRGANSKFHITKASKSAWGGLP